MIRSHTGERPPSWEVDFILGDREVAVEVKGTNFAQVHHLKGLIAFGRNTESAAAFWSPVIRNPAWSQQDRYPSLESLSGRPLVRKNHLLISFREQTSKTHFPQISFRYTGY